MRILRAVLVGLLVLFIGMVAVVLLVQADANLLKRPLTAWVSAQLGRPFVIDGELAIRAGNTLYLSAEGVRIPDVSAGVGPDMLAIERLAIEVDTWSLLERPVVVRRVDIDGADLQLNKSETDADAADGDDGDFEWPESLPVLISEIVISGSRVLFTAPRLSRPVDLRLTRLTQTHVASGVLKLDGEGQLNELPLRIQGSAGPFDNLLSARDFGIAVNVAAGDVHIGVETRIDSLANPSGSTFKVTLRAPDTDYLRTNLGLRDLGPGPVELDGEASPDPGGEGLRGSLKGRIGQFTVEASGELADPATMKKASLNIDLSGPDLEFAGAVAGIDHLPAEAFRLKSSLTREQDRLRIDDATLAVAGSDFSVRGTVGKISSMEGLDLTFAFKGPDVSRARAWLGLPAQLGGGYSVSGQLKTEKDGRQSVDMTVATNLANLRIAGKLGAYPDYYATRVRIEASGDNLATLGEAGGISRLPASRFTASGDVEWSPRGIVLRAAELAAGPDRLTLDGRIGREPLGADTDVRFAISGENLAGLTGSTGFGVINGLPSASYSLKGRLRRAKNASRLDDVTGTLAGARVVASGRIGDTPARDTDLEFSIEGPRLGKFAGLLPGYTLPDGAFSADGSIALNEQGLVVEGLKLSAAGAQATADARLALPLNAAAGQFNVQARGPDLSPFLPHIGNTAMPGGAFDLAARGTVANGRWKFETAELSSGLGRVAGSGTLAWAPDFSATRLQLEIQADSLADVGRLADISLPAEPFEITAEFSGTPTALVARNARGRLGESDFAGQFTVSLADRPTVDVELKTSMLDLRRYILSHAEPEPEPEPEKEKATAARGAARTARLIPDRRLPLDWLRNFDASVSVQADRARIGNLALGNASLRFTVRNGDLVVEALDAQGDPDGHLTVSGGLTQRAGIASLQINVSGTRIALSFPTEAAEQHKARPRGDFELELAGQGETLRELAASLNGRLSLLAGPGEVPGFDAGKYFGSLWRQLVGVVSPGFDAQPFTKVACLGAYVSAKDGVLSTVPALVLQSDRSNIIARGVVNLGTEEIDILLRITSRGRLDINIAEIVNPNVRLAGTLASPSTRVDTKTSILGGGAAFATAGLSIVALNVWDRVFKAKDPCAEIAKEAKSLESGEAPKRRSLVPKVFRRP